MKLKEIKLLGFKSFSKKTEFKLKAGITTFVGPNGCGKTNIIDAIRWCVGETGTKTLRAERVEDLIFAGTESRPPLGMAEVKLVFENNGGIPLDYEEVEVKRQFFRSGEGKFLINNTPCRLRDIQNLFANSGFRSAILDQQMIEDFLISDSDMRRELLESIAGIKRYKEDRKEALNKLGRVERALEKIEIILGEKKKIIRTLSREANRAKRVRKLYEELKEMVILSSKSKLYSINTELGQDQKAVKKLKEKLEKILTRLVKGKREIEWSEEELTSRRKEYIQLTRDIEELQENVSTLREEKAGYEGELKRILNLLKDLPADIESVISQLEKVKNELNETIEKISSRIPEYEAEKKSVNEDLQRISPLIESIKGRDLSLSIKIEEQQSRIHSLLESLKEHTIDLKSRKDQLNKLNNLTVDNEKELKDNAKEINKLETEIEGRETKKASLLRQLQNEKSELNRIEKEIQFYESWAGELSEGMKLIKERMNLPILSDNIEVEEGYEKAVETIMGDFINGAVGSIDDIKKAIDMINEESLKGGIFIVDNAGEQKEGGLKDKVFGEYSHLLNKELSAYQLAKDLKEALVELSMHGGSWITLEGDIIKDKFISLSQGKEGVLARRAKKEHLKEEARDKQQAIKKMEVRIEKIVEEIDNRGTKLKTSMEKREELVDKRSDIEFDINRLKYEIKSVQDDQSSDQKEIKNLNKSITEMQEERKDIEERLTGLNKKLSGLEKKRETLENRLYSNQRERESMGNKVNGVNQQLSKLKSGLSLLGEKEKLDEERVKLGENIKQESRKLTNLKEKVNKLNKELEEKEREINKSREGFSNDQEEKNKTEREIDTLKMEIAKLEYQEKGLTNEVFREFGVTIESEDTEIDQAIDEEIEKLREKIESLKPINPLAVEQFEEKREELEQIKEDHNDLLDSKKDIEDSIREIDRKAVKQFRETFANIRKEFQFIYERLSPNGKADIRLSGDDILESNIEVWVQPEGKRLKRMELFSTGEKTLAAVALLLAIMRMRKSPIYIMDEIDAPLDENNIERLISLLQNFSEKAQILLVTHNRRTMEASNSIYGITMEEQGVSTVLSINLNDKRLELSG